jgi:hypothetical protein
MRTSIVRALLVGAALFAWAACDGGGDARLPPDAGDAVGAPDGSGPAVPDAAGPDGSRPGPDVPDAGPADVPGPDVPAAADAGGGPQDAAPADVPAAPDVPAAADAAAEDGGAGPEDAGAPPAGACTNAADQAWFAANEGAIGPAIEGCAPQCILSPDQRPCAFDCLRGAGLGLSDACLDCFAGNTACALASCALPCGFGSDAECDRCQRDSGCIGDFEECSGIARP